MGERFSEGLYCRDCNYSACRRRGGVLKWPRFCIFFNFFSVSQVGAALMGDTAGTSSVSRPKHGGEGYFRYLEADRSQYFR